MSLRKFIEIALEEQKKCEDNPGQFNREKLYLDRIDTYWPQVLYALAEARKFIETQHICGPPGQKCGACKWEDKWDKEFSKYE